MPEEISKKLVLVGSVNLALRGELKQSCLNGEGDQFLPFAYLTVDIEGVEVEFFDVLSKGNSHYYGVVKPEELVSIKLDNLTI